MQTYASSLLELTTRYCQLLSYLELLPDHEFHFDTSYYPSRLLHRRNVELLALVIVNLGFYYGRMKTFREVWKRVSKIRVIPQVYQCSF